MVDGALLYNRWGPFPSTEHDVDNNETQSQFKKEDTERRLAENIRR